uniref:MAGE domain-containing protein n=1 Tax=Sus scrofa TaxID=9823 RepID=A0A8D1QT89_PIG
MPVDQLRDLCKMEAELQAPAQPQTLAEALPFGSEEEAETPSTPSPSSSSGPPPSSVEAEASLWDIRRVMMADLVGYLLLKYHAKEPITKAEMLGVVPRDAQDQFPDVFCRASACMLLAFGLDLKEVDPGEHTYALVPTLGLTWDGVLSDDELSLPKTGLLVVVLVVIFLQGDCSLEEEIWRALGRMGVCAGKVHYIYGEPRALLTQVWVQEGYLEYRQVPHSDPARYEFLWGPRAHAETSKVKILEHLLRVNGRVPRSCRFLPEEVVNEEEEGP